MDYKYIEQLLERYWECQTTLEEEAILHTFFAQSDIPASLLPYRDLFQAEAEMGKVHLDDDFTQRVMERIAQENQTMEQGARSKEQGARGKEQGAREDTSPALTISLSQRLRPLWRAAASVAIVLSIGMATQQGFQRGQDGTSDNDAWATTTGQTANAEDTIQLFIEQPQPSEQAEAVLTTTTDSVGLGVGKP